MSEHMNTTKEARQRLANCDYKITFGYIEPGQKTFRTHFVYENKNNTMRVENQRGFHIADFEIVGDAVDTEALQKVIHKGHTENP